MINWCSCNGYQLIDFVDPRKDGLIKAACKGFLKK